MATISTVRPLLRRVRVESHVIVLLFVLIAITGFVFAAAPRLVNRMADDGLRYDVAGATGVERNLQFSRSGRIEGGDEPFDRVAETGVELAAGLPESVRSLIGGDGYLVETIRFQLLDEPRSPSYLTLRYQGGVEDHIEMRAGRTPTGSTELVEVPDASLPDGQPVEARLFEVALSTTIAAELGLELGDRLFMNPDPDLHLPQLADGGNQYLAAEVVGLYEVPEPEAEYWLEDTALERSSVVVESIDLRLTYATALFAPAAYSALLEASPPFAPFHYSWRYFVDAERFDAGRLTQLVTDLQRLETKYPAFAPLSGGEEVTTLRTGLSRVAEGYLAQYVTSEAVLAVAAIGPAAVAAGAIGLVAVLVIGRRRSALLLLRGRGASTVQILGAQLVEALLVAVPAALLAYQAAGVLVGGRASGLSATAAVLVASGSVLLLLAATLPLARHRLRSGARDEASVLRLRPRRLVFEGLVVVLAAVAAYSLLDRGLVGASSAGELPAVDPFLAAVPLLLSLAVGLLTLRLYPLPVFALAWLAALRRDLVPVLALRRATRQPSLAHLPLLVLLMTVGIGSFSSVMLFTIERGQVDTSWQQAGADYQVRTSGIVPLPEQFAPAAVAGVEAAAYSHLSDIAAFSDRRFGPGTDILLDAIEPAAYATVTAGTPAAPRFPAVLLAEPGSEMGTEANPVPAILSRDVPAGTEDLRPGDGFEMNFGGRRISFVVAQRRATFPGLGEERRFVVAPLEMVRAALPAGRLPATAVFVRAPANADQTLRGAIAAQAPATTIISRAERYERLHAAPLVAGVATAFGLAVVIAAAYAALAVTIALVLSAAARAREVAQLRTLGLSRGSVIGLAVVEHGPPIVVALVAGTALGLGLAWLIQPGLDLGSFIGAELDVELRVDWAGLGVIGLTLVAIVAAGIIISSWVTRRTDLAQAMRGGDE